MNRLRVGLNALFLKPRRVGGTEEYVRRLIESLAVEAADEVALTVFVNRSFAASVPSSESPIPSSAAPIVVAPTTGDVPPIRIAVESSWLPREAARRRLDLVHHLGNTIPHVRTRPAVVTIHDLQPIVRPHDFGAIKGAYLRDRLRRSARAARAIATPTEFVRRQVVDELGLDEAHVVVVPAPVPPASSADTASRIADGIASPFFVYPAITHPHKNHVTLLRAFSSLAASDGEIALVLPGGAGASEDAVAREIDRLRLRDRVHRLGWVPRRDLDGLLASAVALTFPSRHEGYGLPVAEAMALGCPVIASSATALPEVVGDAGVLVDPDDVGAWTEAMSSLLADDDARSRLAAAGRARVAGLSPKETARRLVRLYRSVTDARG